MAVLHRLADNMLTTYLGNDAGKRVLSGKIKRGEGDTVRAALVMADMRGSTFMLAEQEGREAYIETLNSFFDAIAAPFNKRGGQILSFMGDGFLAVYPCDRHREPSEIACRAALTATQQCDGADGDSYERRRAEGRTELGYGIGLHVGNVMFGNVGLNDRLTFSAFGSAVNEVQRRCCTKKHPHAVIASEEFVSYCGGGWVTIGKEQLRGVREKLTVLYPDATEIAETDEDAAVQISYDGVSDAEQLTRPWPESGRADLPQNWRRSGNDEGDRSHGDCCGVRHVGSDAGGRDFHDALRKDLTAAASRKQAVSTTARISNRARESSSSRVRSSGPAPVR